MAKLAFGPEIAADDPDAVVTVGDNAYGSAGQDTAVGQYYHSFIGGYAGAYGAGSPTNRFFPALGNHDRQGRARSADAWRRHDPVGAPPGRSW